MAFRREPAAASHHAEGTLFPVPHGRAFESPDSCTTSERTVIALPDLPPSYAQATAERCTAENRDEEVECWAQNPHVDPRSRMSVHTADTNYQPSTSSRTTSLRAQTHYAWAGSELKHTASNQRVSEDALLDQALEVTTDTAPPSVSRYRLAKPIAVPQVANGMGKPFARAYAPALRSRGVSMDHFVEFIDNLNVVSTASPPLQVLDLAGGVVGMVPHHVPQLVGHAVSLTAKLGTAAVSKGRASVFLENANADFFAPRGLRVELATSEALRERLGMPRDADLVARLDESEALDVQSRRMVALRDYTSQLSFDVPPPNEQTNVLERMGAWQVAQQVKRSDQKALKDREKAVKKAGKSSESSKAQRDMEKEIRKIEKERCKRQSEFEKEMTKVERRQKGGAKEREKIERKRQKEAQKLDREAEKAAREFDKETGKEREDVRKEDKEAELARKVLWILVEDI